MSDIAAPALAASASAAGATATGLPPQMVLVCAVLGAIIGVWISRPAAADLTVRWLLGAVGLVAAYATAAVLATVIGVPLLEHWEVTKPLAKTPLWAVAGALGLGGWWLWPRLAARLDAWKRKGDGE